MSSVPMLRVIIVSYRLINLPIVYDKQFLLGEHLERYQGLQVKEVEVRQERLNEELCVSFR